MGCLLGGRIAGPARASSITNYSDPSIRSPIGIAVGSDGAVRLTDSLGMDTIGQISNTGTVTTPTPPSMAEPGDIVAGPKGTPDPRGGPEESAWTSATILASTERLRTRRVSLPLSRTTSTLPSTVARPGGSSFGPADPGSSSPGVAPAGATMGK